MMLASNLLYYIALHKKDHIMSDKLDRLRAEMATRGIDGFFVPRADEFQGEYVPDCNDRLAWISGFTGSAGSAVVLKDKASFFTDGRYTLQAQDQVDAKDFEICSLAANQNPIPTLSPAEWIEKNLAPGATFGIHAWVHTPNEAKKIKAAVEKAGGKLVFLESNPLDDVWMNRPAPPQTPCLPHPLEFSGKESSEKIQDVSAALKAKGVKALAVTLPEEICWLLNVRGNDVPCTPFTLSYAIVDEDGGVQWFVDLKKIPPQTVKWVGADVVLHDIGEFQNHLAALAKTGKKIWIDPAASPVKAQNIVTENGGQVHAERSPIQLMKAIKNAVEIQGAVNSHIRDGVALTRFMAAIAEDPKKFDEMSAADLLEKLRSAGKNFKGLSFDTISGAGGNGAIVHYRSSPRTNQPLTSGPIYLVDSGGQYLDGTTDVTRTICVGDVTAEMKEHVTRVLKGHIQVALSVFPQGTTGDVLDVKARAALKDVGLDYAHGTGHGVGSYLSVHEGPCGISPMATTVALEPGMVISNEPGFYKQGAYGIRIESLVTVIDTGKKDAGGKALLAFKTLTMAPIDRNLIEPSLLTDEELKWLNDYHADVRKNLAPLLATLDPKAAAFLQTATDPILKPPYPPANGLKIKGFFL